MLVSWRHGRLFEPLLLFIRLCIDFLAQWRSVFVPLQFGETREGSRISAQRSQLPRLDAHLSGAGRTQKWAQIGRLNGVSCSSTVHAQRGEGSHPWTFWTHPWARSGYLLICKRGIGARPSVVLQNYFSSHLLGAECLCSPQVYMLKIQCPREWFQEVRCLGGNLGMRAQKRDTKG